MKERFTVVPAVYLVFERGGQVLLLQRANTSYFDGMHGLPAGHVDGDEPAIMAAVREAKEETGLNLTRSQLQLVHTMHRKGYETDGPKHERIDMFFRVKNWTGEPQNMEPHKCSELAWYNLDNLPETIIPEVAFALNKIAKGEIYSDYNFT